MTRSRHSRHVGRGRRPALVVPVSLLAACAALAALAALAAPVLGVPPHRAQGPAARHGVTVTMAADATHAGRPVAPAAGGPRVPGAPHCPMFPASNVWNTDVSRLPVDAHSAAWLASMGAAGRNLHPDFGPDPGGYPYGLPVTIVTKAHALVTIRFDYAGESNKGPYPFDAATLIEGGRNSGGDQHAIMVNKQTCTLYELYDARYSASGSRAGSGAIWSLKSSFLRHAGWTSADAAGLPILPGLLNFGEIRAAVRTGTPIRHALRFTAQHTRTQFIWPARHQAGSGPSQSLPPMGARFRLSASFSVARFCDSATTPYCRDAQAVLTEMQHYGMILADNGSNWFFQGSAFPQWPDALISLLKQIPASAFQAVNESCLMVSPDSGQARAKPGCPVG